MSELNFIERNPTKVLEEISERYEIISNETLQTSSPERILIDILAYRENLLREAIQQACLQNTVDFAAGVFLDSLGRLLGVARIEGEDDEALRQRIRLAPEQFASGTKSAYRFHALSVGARDALVYSYNEKNTVPIGVVRVAVTGQNGEPDAGLKESVLIALNDEKTRCVCDVIEIANDVSETEVIPFVVDFEIGLKVKDGFLFNEVSEEVRGVLLSVLNEYQNKFLVEISWANLAKEILNLESVIQVELNSPLSPIKTPSFPEVRYFQIGTINFIAL
jgi:phage-related baseplate assembly protein